MSTNYRKAGCTSCKKTRKKCDELIPKCSHCQRREIECDYGSLFILVHLDSGPLKGSKLKNSALKKLARAPAVKQQQKQLLLLLPLKVKIEHPMMNPPPPLLIHPEPVSTTNNSQLIESAPFDANLFDFQDVEIDLKYLDSILAVEERNLTPVIPTEEVLSDRLVFDWDSISPEDLSKIIELNDPFLKDPSLPFDDPKVSNFIDAYFRQSKCIGNYIFNPKTSENVLIDWMQLLAPSYPILNHVVYVMTSYHISVLRPQDTHWLLMKNEYLKKCIDTLTTKINTHHPFELVSLLTVVILFYSVDTSTTSNTWRKHLTCAFSLIQRFDYFFPTKESVGEMYDERLTDVSFNLYHFFKDNFLYAECIAWISSPHGGILKTLPDVDFLFARDSYCEPILVDHLVLVKGSSRYVTTVFGKLIRIFIILKDRYNINISGSNCVFVTIPQNDFHQAGLELIDELTEIEYKNLDLTCIEDTNLRTTLRYSNRAFILGLKLFIMVTLLREPIYSKKIQELSQMIADCATNMPYAESQSVGIHWPMFIAALCSLPGPLRQIFIGHITNIVDKGLTVATYTLKRLNLAWDCMANHRYFDESMYDNITF